MSHVTPIILAMLVLLFVIPALPSSLILQPISATVDGDKIIFNRSVTFPVNAHWTNEFERISPPPPENHPECATQGRSWYERRTTPIVYKHGCTFDGPVNAQWLYRGCWQVNAIFGRLRPVCLTTTFFPNAGAALQEQQVLQNQVERLEQQVRGLQLAPAGDRP